MEIQVSRKHDSREHLKLTGEVRFDVTGNEEPFKIPDFVKKWNSSSQRRKAVF